MAPEKDYKAELEALQLEEYRYRVQELRGIQRTREIRRAAIEQSLKDEREGSAQLQSLCAHKKGGMGLESMYRGNDPNYAVVKFVLPTGPMIVICQRCFKLWEQPDPALAGKGATAEDRKLYARQAREYNEAVAYPTDNTTGGSRIFVVTDNRAAA